MTLPALVCALIGITHPMDLTDASAEYWRNLHIVLIPVFPLIGLAPWLIARVAGRGFGIAGAVLGYGYATFYTSLDLLAGVGGGAMVMGGQSDATGPLFQIARALAAVGAWSLILGTLVAVVAAIRAAGVIALPGGLLAIAGAALLYRGHIYFPVGTLSMLLLVGGFAALALVVSRPSAAIANLTQ